MAWTPPPSANGRRSRQRPKAYTLGNLIGDYMREHAEGRHCPHTLVDTRRYLERDWAPLHSLPAGDVTRREVSARLIELTRSAGPVGANRARGKLSSAFCWGIKAGLVDHNPTIGTIRNEEASRERTLSIDELRAIWEASAELTAHDAIVRLLMLTGQRKAEIGGLAWAELDRAGAMVVLSGQRTKNAPAARGAAVPAGVRDLPGVP